MKTKKCSNKNCKHLEKYISEFGKDRKVKDGLNYWCKVCVKEYRDKSENKTKAKEHRDNPKNKAKRKEYRDKNKEKIANQTKEYRDKNCEKIIKRAKEYNNKPENKAKRKEYNAKPENKEKNLKQCKEYRAKPENKIKISKQKKLLAAKPENKIKQNQNARNRRKTDINFKLKENLRSRVNKVLKNNIKSKSTMKLLGCTIEDLKRHLESQFTDGMIWDNHGRGDNGKKEWHIDHIKPCAKFDLSKKSEQLECFNYTNLQPLWAEDNLRKSDKY